MRVNATIAAILALAASSLVPADASARAARHPVHKSAVASPTHRKVNPKVTYAKRSPGKRSASIGHVPTKRAAAHTHSRRVTSSSANKSEATFERTRLLSAEEVAATPIILPSLYNKRGRLIVPPPLKGSRDILMHQNLVADRDGLDRIQDDEDLLDMRRDRLLVSLPSDKALQIDDRLPMNRRYCRPWTMEFLITLARAHYAQFHTPLQVNSAVRTVEFQQHLVHINGNAAPAEGDTASPHLTGQAIDIAKHGLSLTEIAWLRGYLLPLVQQGKIDVEEEFQQACFHISVYKKYLPLDGPRTNPDISHHGGTTALATTLR
jgi:hypothetical protein